MLQKLKDKLNLLPQKTGCYLMKDSSGTILYVGKAKNLHSRVRSYFTGSHNTKTTKLVSQITDFEYIITDSETEALVLENNLIKEYDPKYNVMMTDDKTYPYICLTSETHPRLIYTRDISQKLGKYYGPYPHARDAKEIVNLLNRLYPIRKCTTLPKKECLYYHLGQCLAPCIKDITEEDYKPIIKNITRILKGDYKSEVKKLTLLMNEASDNLQFERAIEYRNIITGLSNLTQTQKMDSNLADCDIFGFYNEESLLSIQIFHIRNGKMIERNGYLQEVIGSAEENFLNFITKFYLAENNPIPNEVIIPEIGVDLSLLDSLETRITVPKRGQKRHLVRLVNENAEEKTNELLAKRELDYARTKGAILELGKLINIPTPFKIEAFDNSNIQGQSAVSAMVVFVHGKPVKQLYRKYRIRTVTGPDDIKTMYEVITRRYKRLKNEQKDFPNLIIVDGNENQVNSAKKALADLNIEIPIAGLTKNKHHRTESLYYEGKVYKLIKSSGLYFLLEYIQSEVHRYAVTFHHQVHRQKTFFSSLDSIPGIGKVRRTKILKLLTDEGVNIESLRELNLSEEQINAVLKVFSSDR